MMLLPKSDKFVEVLRRDRKYMPYVRFASIRRPRCVYSVRQRNAPIEAQIRYDLDFGVETVNVPWLVIHRVGYEPDAAEP